MACFLVIAVKYCTRQIDRTTPLGGKMNDESRELGLLPHKTRTSAPRKSVSYVVPAKEIKKRSYYMFSGLHPEGLERAINQDLPKTLAELIGSVLSEGSEVHVIVKCTEGEAIIEFIGSEEQIVLAEHVMTNLSS